MVFFLQHQKKETLVPVDPDPPVVVGRHLPRGDGVGPAAGEVVGAKAVAEDDQVVAVSSRACLIKK